MNSSPEENTETEVGRRDFMSLFCERYRCPVSEFEERAFRKCLPWRARLLAPLIRAIFPRYFEQDFALIRYLGQAVGQRDAMREMVSFIEANNSRDGFARKTLRIRVSARKAGKLLRRLAEGK
jgi:hypothetical protein